MKNSQLKCLLLVLSLVFTNFMSAQGVTGTVSDSKGPLPGVSVLVKGTSNGTQTDFEGKYKINNAGGGVLVFSFIGYKTKEISVAGKSVVNVTLDDDAQNLKEVMVIGYGTVKKKDATGAVDQLSSKKFDNVAATSPAELLRGKTAGVQVTSTSGEPGAGISVRVRGAASFRAGNDPLYVVDGIPLGGGDISSGSQDLPNVGTSSARNPLNFINQSDIESMTILKDASATAIYGSRGANGVIIITTKKGKSKEPELSINSSVSLSNYYSQNFEMLDADGYIAAGGKDNGSRSYDWKKAILQTGITTNNDISLSKSTENSSTRFSLGINNTEGIVKNTGIDKYTASIVNVNDLFGGKLRVDTRLSYAGLKDRATLITNNAGFVGNLIGSALYWDPTLSTRNPDGTYNTSKGNTYFNPEQLLDGYTDFTNTNKLLGSINASLKITNDLKYQFIFGVENSNSKRKFSIAPTIDIQQLDVSAPDPTTGIATSYKGSVGNSGVDKFNTTIENLLTYNKKLSDNFEFDALLGYSKYEFNSEGENFFAVGFNKNQTDLINNTEGVSKAGGRLNPSSFKNRIELQSFFARTNLTIYKNLLVTATIRRDGSSRVGINNTYDNFPSFGVAYKLVNDKEGFLNNIKIRGSYGKTGNSELPVNAASTVYTYNNLIAEFVNNGNPDLKWETTLTKGAGLDFEILKNRVSGSFDVYEKETSDLITGVDASPGLPGPSVNRYANLEGKLINRGIEAGINAKILDSADFSWELSANAAFLENELKGFSSNYFADGGAINGPGLTNAFVQPIENGRAYSEFYLAQFNGYDATGKSLPYGEKQFTGKQALPKITAGLSTTFSYKSVDLTASFYGAFGHYIYNNTANALFFRNRVGSGFNVTKDVIESGQSASDENPTSTKYLEKGDFIRLGNLTLGYTFKNAALESLKIKNARLFVNGSNLFVITDYSGFDPEVDTNKAINGIPSSGIDYLSYPRARTITFGVNLTF
jgi:TonB-dependent starch-binding outer membrane protein SusC